MVISDEMHKKYRHLTDPNMLLNHIKNFKIEIIVTLTVLSIFFISSVLIENNQQSLITSLLVKESDLQMEQTQVTGIAISYKLQFIVQQLTEFSDKYNLVQQQNDNISRHQLIEDVSLNIKKAYPIFNVYFVNENGTIIENIRSEGLTYVGKNLMNKEDLKSMSKSHEPEISAGIEFGNVTQIMVTHPILSDDGTFKGAIRVSIPASDFFSSIISDAKTQSGFFAILDKNHVYVSTPRTWQIGKNFFSDEVQKYFGRNEMQNKMYGTVFSGQSSYGIYTFNGVERINTGYPILVNGKTTFFVFHVLPTVEIYAEAERIFMTQKIEIISILSVMAIVLFVLVWMRSRRLKIEKKVSQTEKKYRNLYEKSPGLLRTISTDGTIIDCNETYAKALGYTKKEVIGMSCYDHTAEKSKGDLKRDIEVWKNNRDVQQSDILMKRKNGSIFPSLLTGSTLYDDTGNVKGRTMVLTDLTEVYEIRKKLEYNESVIREQYEDLKRLDTAKEEFSSMITHELKTPLTPIKGYCEMLSDPEMMGKLNFEQLQSINEIYLNTIRLERLIADVLDAQKLDMNRMHFNKTEFDVRNFILSIETDLSHVMKEKQTKFVNNVNHFHMNSDKDRLYQVLNNLIRNSIDFVPAGKGRIEVGAYFKDSNVIFYVKDNGIGIPKDKQGNIFKKFYQIDTSASRKHGGTGLGLAICKGIIEGLGGKIWFESKQGEGTIFYFSLPINDKN